MAGGLQENPSVSWHSRKENTLRAVRICRRNGAIWSVYFRPEDPMTPMTRREFTKGAALAPLAVTPPTTLAPQAAPTSRFDVVIAGAGHNSLITAAYLAKGGFRCLVLEGRPLIGGDVKTAELTLRGFKHDTCSSAHNGIQENPLLRDNELNLADYGLEYIFPDPVFHMPFLDGGYITQWRDLDRTCAT